MGTHRFGPTVVETAADSPDDLAFLAAIMAHQLDDTPKLVYADWLEDRNDPRAAFVREFVERARDPRDPLPAGDEFPLPWRQVIGLWHRRAIRALIADGRLTGPHADRAEPELLRRARPKLHMLTVPAADAELPPGISKFGGLPDLPDGIEWPVFPDPDSWSTSIFCAQLRLTDLRGTLVGRELPAGGLLSFFFMPPDSGPVLYQPEGGPLRRPDPPYDPYWDRGGWYDRPFYPLPSGSLRVIEGIDLPLSEEFGALPAAFFEENWQPLDELFWRPPEVAGSVGAHQLLGYGWGGLHYDISRTHWKPGLRWLATFGLSDPDPRAPVWPDSGQPFWFISGEDLVAGRLERSWCEVMG